jgi:chemotaxis response regulator CheB
MLLAPSPTLATQRGSPRAAIPHSLVETLTKAPKQKEATSRHQLHKSPAGIKRAALRGQRGELGWVMRTLHPEYIVGIGGSAGGLDAYKTLLDALPSDTGMAFVVVAHLHPTAHSQLAEILSRHTKMPVAVASTAMPVRANHVYVIPPDTDLFIESYTFKLVSPRARRNVQVDLFFSSLAAAMGARAIGIVVSGYDGDGTEGCKQIKAKGGTTFAQDMSAEVNLMPRHAEAAGCIDFVLPADKISEELQKLARASGTPSE